MHATMEQTKQWMWSRRKLSESPFLGTQIHMISSASSYNESWEERAFAQDSAGHLRRYIWPPRSYSCSFCQREFRSAQALGGHMNVHRRDRARLRQWSSPAVDDDDNDQDHHNKTCTPLVGSLAYDSNSSKPNPSCGSLASPLFPRVSEAATRAFTEHALVSPSSYPSSVARESSRESHFTTSQSFAIPELNLVRENLKLREVGSVVSRDSNDEEIISIKRRRTDSVFPCFLRDSSGCQQHDKFEVLKPSRNPVEEIDLELRLGGSPKLQQNSKDVRYG